MKTLYISDLDGTLLDNNAEVSGKTAEVINKLIARGMAFTYATARSWHSAGVITRGLNLTLPAVTYNGAFLVQPKSGEVLRSFTLDGAHAGYAVETLSRLGLSPLIYSIVSGAEKVMWLRGRESAGTKRYLDSRDGDGRLLPVDTREDLIQGTAFYLTVIGEKHELTHAFEIFSENGNFTVNFLADAYKNDEYWLELYHRAAGKASGISRLKEILGYGKTVCFGDNLNDLSMFLAADECYATGNAVSELKEIATGIIGKNTENGVAKWLENNVFV